VFTLKFPKTKPTQLEEEIARILDEMSEMKVTDPEYVTYADRLVQLYKLKEVDSDKRVSKDTMVAAATNLAGILIIISYEHAHVFGSRAASFVLKNIK
jgi:hypothetical protein